MKTTTMGGKLTLAAVELPALNDWIFSFVSKKQPKVTIGSIPLDSCGDWDDRSANKVCVCGCSCKIKNVCGKPHVDVDKFFLWQISNCTQVLCSPPALGRQSRKGWHSAFTKGLVEPETLVNLKWHLLVQSEWKTLCISFAQCSQVFAVRTPQKAFCGSSRRKLIKLDKFLCDAWDFASQADREMHNSPILCGFYKTNTVYLRGIFMRYFFLAQWSSLNSKTSTFCNEESFSLQTFSWWIPRPNSFSLSMRQLCRKCECVPENVGRENCLEHHIHVVSTKVLIDLSFVKVDQFFYSVHHAVHVFCVKALQCPHPLRPGDLKIFSWFWFWSLQWSFAVKLPFIFVYLRWNFCICALGLETRSRWFTKISDFTYSLLRFAVRANKTFRLSLQNPYFFEFSWISRFCAQKSLESCLFFFEKTSRKR